MKDEKQKTILLIEDEIIISNIQSIQLEQYGYNVIIANSGEAALEIIENENSIDLILLDLNLGIGIDGTETARKILKNHLLPIIFMSNYSEDEIIEKTADIPSYGFIPKNSGIKTLDSTIKIAFKLFETNKKLSETNEILKLAQISSRAGSWDWDIKNNSFYWSEGFLMLLGIDFPVEANLETWEKIVHPDDLETAKKNLFSAIQEKKDLINDYRIILPNKEIRWIHTTGKTYCDNDKPHRIIGLCFDITEQKKIELEKKEVEERILLLSNNIKNGYVYQLDAGEDGKSRKITYISNTVQQLHEISVEEAKKDVAWMYGQIIEPEMETIVEKENQALLTMSPFSAEIKFLLPSGKIRWGLVTSSPRRLMNNHLFWEGVEIDITEQKEYELKKDEILEQILLLSNNITNGMVYQIDTGVDGKSRKFTFISNSVQKLHGVSSKEVEQDEMAIYGQIVEPKLSELIEKENISIEKKIPFMSEIKFLLPTGKIRWGLFTSSPRKLINNHLVWDGVEVDITEKKEFEYKIIKLLEEKELLLREVNHRIKNNIATIEGILMLQLETVNNIETTQIIQDVIGRIQSIGILYDRLSKNNDFVKTSFKDYLTKLIDEIVSVFPNSLPIKIEKEIDNFEIDGKILFTLGILFNELMTNIMKYAFVGKDNGVIRISASLHENKVKLIIYDNGIEFSGDNDFQNSKGFGLSLVNMLVLQINGNFKIEIDNGTKRILEFNL